MATFVRACVDGVTAKHHDGESFLENAIINLDTVIDIRKSIDYYDFLCLRIRFNCTAEVYWRYNTEDERDSDYYRFANYNKHTGGWK